MSVPRLRRTVTLTPRAPRRSRNAATRSGGVPVVGQPGVGLSGIRLTWAGGGGAGERGELGGVRRPVVDSVDEGPFEA